MEKVGVVSLGCSKNRVDTEKMLGMLKAAGYEIVQKPQEAEWIIVNTCGFITSAKEESIHTIFEMSQFKKMGKCKKLIVTGCLSQRYGEEMKREMPEVDLFLGVNEYDKLLDQLNPGQLNGSSGCRSCGRILTTPGYYAYLRIADGCDNRCTYCAIPSIRGAYQSVDQDKLVCEAQDLADRGVKELVVIAQDTTRYGKDIYGKPVLPQLLRELVKIEKLKWIRVLYAYPDSVTDELIDVMASSEKIVKYLDLPIQHTVDEILKRMNRRGNSQYLEQIIRKFRSADPRFILRTSIIVGFPGETEAQFQEMMDFLRQNPFDRIGAFEYSAEEGTPAAVMPTQVDDEIKRRRLDLLMRQQQAVSAELNRKRTGQKTEVLIEGMGNSTYYGRSYAEAPEIDGKIFIKPLRTHVAGEFIKVLITGAKEYDLLGEELE